MERERYEQELLEYVEGRLDAARADAVRATLRHDPKMRARVEGMQRDREQLMREPMEERAPAGGVERAITQAERDALVEARPARRRGHSWKAKVGALAAVLALATLGSLWAWDVANKSAQIEPLDLELPYGDNNLSPNDGWEDPGDVPLGTDLASSIRSLVDEGGQGGSASELEYARPIEEAVAANEGPKPDAISLDDIAALDPAPELMGPVYVAAIGDDELARAVGLAGEGRLVLVVDFEMPWEGDEAAWATLAGAVDREATFTERVEPWQSDMAGTDLADEVPAGEALLVVGPTIDGAEQAVFEQEGRERFVIIFDDAGEEEIAASIVALAERSREMGGVMGVQDREDEGDESGLSPEGIGEEADEKTTIEVVIRWSGC